VLLSDGVDPDVTDSAGQVFQAATPTGQVASWHRVASLPGGGTAAIACPSDTACVAVDQFGRAAVGRAG